MATPKFDKEAGVILRKNLVEITLARTEATTELFHAVCKNIDLHKNDILTFTQGLREITIITEDKHEKTILNAFKKTHLIKRIDDLASLSLSLPEQAYRTHGLLYLAMKAMYDARINIVEIVSTLTELTIIVADEDAEDAQFALQMMITQYS